MKTESFLLQLRIANSEETQFISLFSVSWENEKETSFKTSKFHIFFLTSAKMKLSEKK